MKDWTFITSHGLILNFIASQPRSTARQIASAIHTTEWTVHRIIAELEKEGYIRRQRSGRRNIYTVNPSLCLRHETVREIVVGDLLRVLKEKRKKRNPITAADS